MALVDPCFLACSNTPASTELWFGAGKSLEISDTYSKKASKETGIMNIGSVIDNIYYVTGYVVYIIYGLIHYY